MTDRQLLFLEGVRSWKSRFWPPGKIAQGPGGQKKSRVDGLKGAGSLSRAMAFPGFFLVPDRTERKNPAAPFFSSFQMGLDRPGKAGWFISRRFFRMDQKMEGVSCNPGRGSIQAFMRLAARAWLK